MVTYLCEKYSSNSEVFKFCPGLDPHEYEQDKQVFRFDPKSAHKSVEPFLRVESVKCPRWHEISKKSPAEKKKADAVVCPPCVRLKCDIEHQIRRTTAESPSKKSKRQGATSHARLSYNVTREPIEEEGKPKDGEKKC